ncbi:hypothetical protein VL12_04280 [Rossellomorea marisflavi]|nr:hypothetical protein VL12_04280 [Rossellomorea marisflavi]
MGLESHTKKETMRDGLFRIIRLPFLRTKCKEQNGFAFTTYSLQKQEGDFPFQISTFLSFAQSEVQRRPPDSYGNSGQGETLQARRSGSPHAPWKAGGRSETERSNLLHTLIKKRWRFPVPNQHISPPPLRVKCSEGHPTPMGIAGRVRPCRQRRSGSPHAPWKAGGRSETERSCLLHILIKTGWR